VSLLEPQTKWTSDSAAFRTNGSEMDVGRIMLLVGLDQFDACKVAHNPSGTSGKQPICRPRT
jgi:hypothetical protein